MKNILFLSNTVTQPFSKLQTYLPEELLVNIQHYEINQIEQFLLSPVEFDVLIILLSHRFFYTQYFDQAAIDKLEQLFTLIANFRKYSKAKILVANLADSGGSVFFDGKSKAINDINVSQFNQTMFDLSIEIPSCSIIDVNSVAKNIGLDRFYRLRSDFVFQSPFSKDAINGIMKEISNSLVMSEYPRFKACLVDADNTLWGGVVGEDGVDGIKIDDNYPGIIYKLFQQQLLELKRSGIILCLVTKNNYEDIAEVFQKKQMPIKLDDFTVVKSNWAPKSMNISTIAEELNLGLDSFCFIDDNIFEVEEVRQALPEVSVVQFNLSDLDSNLAMLKSIQRFSIYNLTEEDASKAELYKSEEERKKIKSTFTSMDDYICSLNIEIVAHLNNRSTLPRTVQLINKTNQFNLTTQRLDETQVSELFDSGAVYSFSVKDKYGDLGLVGVLIIKNNKIENFLLSCRVLGRKIEDKIIYEILNRYNVPLHSTYLKSQKNGQVEQFYDRIGFEVVDSKENEKSYLYSNKIHKVKDVPFIAFEFANS